MATRAQDETENSTGRPGRDGGLAGPQSQCPGSTTGVSGPASLAAGAAAAALEEAPPDVAPPETCAVAADESAMPMIAAADAHLRIGRFPHLFIPGEMNHFGHFLSNSD